MITFRRNRQLPKDSTEMPEFEKWELIRRAMDLHGGQNWKRRFAKMLFDEEGVALASGGQFYQDTRPPWLLADTATVTLTTTMKQLWPTAELTPTYQTDWWDGKLFLLRCFGRITTPATAGTLQWQMGYGTADGTTGALATSAALTAVSSQTNISWRFEGRVRCRSRGNAAAAGILLGVGVLEFNTAVVAAGQALVPATAAAQVGSLNLAQTSGIHLQALEAATSGATITMHDLQLSAEN
jgi:hypothetical protein